MKFHKIIYILFLSALFSPILQKNLLFIDETELGGDYVPEKKPLYFWHDYINLFFQDKIEKYLNENFGFRNTLLRLRNQIYFSCFNQSPYSDYNKVRNGYLFDNRY